ncbi:hypothetical protein VM1G_10560 [Cytospora mali]|uniref:Phosphoglycerate mutase n=1 Tax=Cytospora mali TaxID=578113 RepID=A0A194VHY5_CYTMA|nr:hypothetical protein VM1G_10560 [Valsa mali]
MGRAPAYIFVVRHGNRLDAADKQWHLHSPTPYDPPLTYSGWNQARAVGQRIAEILRERELQDETAAAVENPPRRRRKYKVVIHSSPFLRCIQTSIGISAGLASTPEPASALPARTNSTTAAANPRLGLAINTEASNLPPNSTNSRPKTPKKTPVIQKTVLRLDAFLGEWLTPGYFELITPPPGSSLMLASAKAELLRKEDYENFHMHHSPYYNHSTGLGAGQMWGQSPIAAQPQSGFENVGSMAGAMRRAGRSDSVTSNGESHLLSGGAYVAPVPSYAVNHNAEIPERFVPHARDNCCDIDYQWDSMRGFLDWGDGGAYGEEWTAMHQRFRKGLQRMVDWYSTADQPTEKVTKERKYSVTDPDECAIEDEEDEFEIESVVVLVSHGAGCNALIGAITHQPVLTDVGLASLTQAIRKPGKDEEIGRGLNRTSHPSNSTSGLVAIHQHYDLRLFASTEHLTRTPRLGSGSMSHNSRGRLSSGGFAASPLSGVVTHDSPGSRSSSATATVRRDSGFSSRMGGRIGLNTNGFDGNGITVGSGVTRFIQRTPTTGAGAGGLWSPLRNNLEPDEEEEDFLPNFSSFDIVTPTTRAEDAALAAAEPSTPAANGAGTGRPRTESSGSRVSPRATPIIEESHDEEAENEVPALPQRGLGMGGLWGSPKPLDEDGIPRDLSSQKRRWTVTERTH